MEAFARWRAKTPAQPTIQEVAVFLSERYHAHPLPLSSVPPTILSNDEELRPHLVAAVFTVTDQATLLEAKASEHGSLDAYLAHLKNEREETADYFRETGDQPTNDWEFLEAPSAPIDPYDVINVQITLGQRVNIVLEAEGNFVTSFKVSGSEAISDHLNALIGYPEPTPDMNESVPRMKRGDLNDVMFVRYLHNAVRHAVI